MAIKNINSQLAKVLVILGPTASGKTKLAVALARKFNGEIISADSRQVYRGMDIGTGKDIKDYGSGRHKVKHHLIDVVFPNEEFDLAKFKTLAVKAIEKILKRGKLPILVGGSGLYLQAVVDNYNLSAKGANLKQRLRREQLATAELLEAISNINPIFAEKINASDRANKRRLVRYLEIVEQGKDISAKEPSQYDFLVFGLDPGRDQIRKKIAERLKERLEREGLVEEIKKLHQQGVSWQRLESFGLEYKFVAKYLQKKLTADKLFLDLNIAICQFAKRQMTWFRRWEKQGRKITWFKNPAKAETALLKRLKDLHS